MESYLEDIKLEQSFLKSLIKTVHWMNQISLKINYNWLNCNSQIRQNMMSYCKQIWYLWVFLRRSLYWTWNQKVSLSGHYNLLFFVSYSRLPFLFLTMSTRTKTFQRWPVQRANSKKRDRPIWNPFYPVCVKTGMGCVIVEGDSFTARMQYVDGQKGLCQNWRTSKEKRRPKKCTAKYIHEIVFSSTTPKFLFF